MLLALKFERDKTEKEVEKFRKEVSSLDKLDELWAKYTRCTHPVCLGPEPLCIAMQSAFAHADRGVHALLEKVWQLLCILLFEKC